mmetsp:Transcript_12013/g.36624  ORF Transcript_12013/g.36624 Transcript_12013/m.36624 type:complete len:407 (-) Transcript_12013:193-1413(-)|eukprot:CAMPEP_0198727504 /NCGR_PEP_ID=MMETSP1475-20131203/4309_1 /TAXON_ID= ORGANISM="Unidentified sp., Strain CCMP1999" /NCGR_SAMPLE_ID=MMETSP1475 /ASSEMBLY_ACC=CAM_ASM_001111 /LENGTH=406 /DNA_ID=CAMNT_0044489553 /DNA_START=56 /DNA_END=1276 /DNA_ORIENTATION=+
MGNSCTHAAKKQTRKFEESIGTKNKKQGETYDGEIENSKKEIEKGVKILEKLLRHIDDSQYHWGTMTTHMGKFHSIAQNVPTDLRERPLMSDTSHTLQNLNGHVTSVDRSEVESGVELIKRYIHECNKTTKTEYKAYEGAKYDYEIYQKDLTKTHDEKKKSELRTSVKTAKGELDVSSLNLKTKLHNLQEHLPLMFETGAVALCASHAGYNVKFSEQIEHLSAVVKKNRSNLRYKIDDFELERKRTDISGLVQGDTRVVAAGHATASSSTREVDEHDPNMLAGTLLPVADSGLRPATGPVETTSHGMDVPPPGPSTTEPTTTTPTTSAPATTAPVAPTTTSTSAPTTATPISQPAKPTVTTVSTESTSAPVTTHAETVKPAKVDIKHTTIDNNAAATVVKPQPIAA